MIEKYNKLFLIISIGIVLFSITAPFVLGVNLSGEFIGGSTTKFRLQTPQQVHDVKRDLILSDIKVDSLKVNKNLFTLRTSNSTDIERKKLFSVLEQKFIGAEVEEHLSFGPSVSTEIINKTIIALIIASFLIVIFISFAFKDTSKPISSSKYGIVSLIALFHDVIIPFGVFSLVGYFLDVSIDVLFVMAILATLGYSINDTIVIFDRIREKIRINKNKKIKEDFSNVIDYGIKKSFRRSIYTSITTAIPLLLLAIYVPTLKWFSFVLFIGVITGTYSSLFLAPSILLIWSRHTKSTENKKEEISEIEKAEQRLKERLRG